MNNKLKEQVQKNKLPNHVAIIMDGNGRWAKLRGKPRIFGHRNGVRAVREVTEATAELGIPFLTLYAFSTENWSRPILEVNALMSLLVDTIHKEVSTMMENNIRLNAIGDLDQLPVKTKIALMEGIEMTSKNSRMVLTLALNYSSRWEIVKAVKAIATKVQNKTLRVDDIDDRLFSQHLITFNIPNPELLIRTSGENRVSNFLLWQIAYTELYFCPVLWPEFSRTHFYEALIDYQKRERRFGKISEQLV